MALRKWALRIIIGLAALVLLCLGALRILRRHQLADIAGDAVPGSLVVRSSSFSDKRNIPQSLTCDGAGSSPDIQLPQPPAATKSFALLMDDLDAPLGFIHWIVYNIPPDTRDLPEGASAQAKLPPVAAEGVNSLGGKGYFGPCPPGGQPHRYVLRLYALDVSADLQPGMTKKQLAAAVKGHVLAEGQLTGLYGRASR